MAVMIVEFLFHVITKKYIELIWQKNGSLLCDIIHKIQYNLNILRNCTTGLCEHKKDLNQSYLNL